MTVETLSTAELKRIIAYKLSQQVPLDERPDDPVGWIEAHFRIPKDEVPSMRLQLAPYQKLMLNTAFAKDERGLYRYTTVLWSDLKKAAKSVIAAAVILWKAWHTEWGQFYIIANDLKQADSRVAYYLRRAIQLHPELNAKCQIKPSGYTVTMLNHTRIEAVPIDPEGEAGPNADFVEITEAWGANTKAHIRMFAEMTPPPAKMGKAMRWLDTYAGFAGESLLLEQLYDVGVRQGRRLDPDVELYANDTARMLTLWNTRPRLPWHTQEFLSAEAKTLTPENYGRYYQNKWASASALFVPLEWWDGCRGTVPAYSREPCVGAIDAAVSDDCFALVLLSKEKNGSHYHVRYARKWDAPVGGKIDFAEPEAEIRRLSEQYQVIQWTYDAFQLEALTMRLMKEGVGYFYAFSQSTKRLIADKQLYDYIRDRNVVHSGEPDLREHVGNANASSNQKDRDQLRIVKRSERLKIDLCVALSMAVSEAVNFNLP